jgi:hypothetical protein
LKAWFFASYIMRNEYVYGAANAYPFN